MTASPRAAHIEPADLLSKLPLPNGDRSISGFRHGTLEVKLYAPRGHDPQTPHRRDELYVVIGGEGEFVHDGHCDRFAAGDVLFVAAGVEHRFERFTDDFAAWVFFFGPEGGEEPI